MSDKLDSALMSAMYALLNDEPHIAGDVIGKLGERDCVSGIALVAELDRLLAERWRRTITTDPLP